MANQAPFFLSVPNSNPNSAFSHFELLSVREIQQPGFDDTEIEALQTQDAVDFDDYAVGPIFYTVYGRYDPEKHPEAFGGVIGFANFSTLDAAKKFLVELNGPLPENHEDE